jgi:hypothetical protein
MATYRARDGDEKWFAKWPRYVPERLGRYYATLAETLEKEKFGTDKDLREAFTEAVGSGVVRFELVEELPVSTCHDRGSGKYPDCYTEGTHLPCCCTQGRECIHPDHGRALWAGHRFGGRGCGGPTLNNMSL